MTPNILVAMPLHGSDIKIQCAVSLAALCSNFAARGIRFRIRNCSSSDLIGNRNVLASEVFADPDCSHLLFIDSDMEFKPETVFRMLELGRPVVGCIYPRRRPTTSRQDFVVDIGEESQLQVVGGAIRVRGVGMGLCLIQRTVLERMASTGELRCTTLRESENLVYGYFDLIAANISEDLSFCHRWASLCSGEVWALVDEEIGHVGEATYKARFLDYVRTTPRAD
jgi:hypothetical protein